VLAPVILLLTYTVLSVLMVTGFTRIKDGVSLLVNIMLVMLLTDSFYSGIILLLKYVNVLLDKPLTMTGGVVKLLLIVV